MIKCFTQHRGFQLGVINNKSLAGTVLGRWQRAWYVHWWFCWTRYAWGIGLALAARCMLAIVQPCRRLLFECHYRVGDRAVRVYPRGRNVCWRRNTKFASGTGRAQYGAPRDSGWHVCGMLNYCRAFGIDNHKTNRIGLWKWLCTFFCQYGMVTCWIFVLFGSHNRETRNLSVCTLCIGDKTYFFVEICCTT